MNKYKKKIAIIGPNSFLASNFISNYSEKYDFTLIGKNRNLNFEKFEFIEFDFPKIKFDLNNFLDFDVIINCAGGGVQSNGNESKLDIYQINLFFPIELVEFLTLNEYKGKLFSFGSYFEIGFNSEDKYFNEEDLCHSSLFVPNAYCDSKRLLTRFYSNLERRINWFHLILPNIYGYGENKNRLIPYLVEQLKSDLPLKLSAGEQVRQYLNVKDLCRLIHNQIENSILPDIYCVPAFEKKVKIKNLVNEVLKLFLKKENDWEVIQTRDEGMAILLLETSKLSNCVSNWTPEVSLKDGISEYL